MPSIYLSPSTQEFNPYVIGGTEEYYMNLIADAMEPYLYATGIDFTRNTPEMTAASSIAASNQGNYDLHLALHS
ncbi:MAG: peptidoglycan hydrolase, partial [Clostridia bacterium]|nr:peptidoglycan hydrolase [Clostridia bacterium]